MKKEFKLIKYKDIDKPGFGQKVDFYLSLAKRKSAYKIFGTNEKGIIILLPSYNGYAVQYIFVKEPFRRSGVCKSLILSALDYCKRYKKVFELKIIFSTPFASSLERFVLEQQFILSSYQRIFIHYRDKLDMEIWREWIYNHLMKVSERFLSRGYKVSPFEEAPKEILEKLNYYFTKKNIPGWETPGDMHPFRNRTDFRWSFICWKDEEPVAYVCNEKYGDSIVCKELFCFKKYFSSGVSIVPLSFFTGALYEDDTIKRVSFLILNDNDNSMRMFMRDYSKLNPAITIQKIYCGNGMIFAKSPNG